MAPIPGSSPRGSNALRGVRPVLTLTRPVAALGISLMTAALSPRGLHTLGKGHYQDEEPEVEGSALWVLYVVSMGLVLLGGAFAGLTIALMGQDSIYLQVISNDPDEPQRKNAKRVYDLLNRGKHWVLVTLLLSNVIVNESLPVVLDRCLGGGIAAVVGSTVLIVIFGEIIPQSLCVRYGLQIGGYMSKPVLLLMWAMAPVAWPTAKLLDWLLGEDHGTVYKKSGLKTLMTLHKSMGELDERLNEDEVTIISAVLDLKRKPVEEVMTPMDDVYTMAEDTILDERTIDQILHAGYSRIPIHEANKPQNFVGMLLVKILITYDPEDGKRVSDFALATLPETRPETSCLDIINFFQEGKSHMVLISEYPGEEHGALGVVTLEDVIEELIGEEIIDESDVYVDVHKAIRRSHPAPKMHRMRDMRAKDANLIDVDDATGNDGEPLQQARTLSVSGRADPSMLSSSPKTTLLMRRSSAGHDGQLIRTTIPVKANYEEMRDHLKHLGPSNRASNPKSTRVSAVKIKPGTSHPHSRSASVAADVIAEVPANGDGADERTSLLRPQVSAKDGTQALMQSYTNPMPDTKGTEVKDAAVPYTTEEEVLAQEAQTNKSESGAGRSPDGTTSSVGLAPQSGERKRQSRGYVRSGSITENVVEAGGIRKVVLEATSSGEDGEVEGVQTPSQSLGLKSEPGTENGDEGDEDDDAAGASADGGASNDGAQQGGRRKNRRRNRK